MDAWEDFVARHQVGDVVPGAVTTVDRCFAAVDLGGVKGRIGVGMLWTMSRGGPCFPSLGTKVHCRILSFDHDSRFVTLSDDRRGWENWEGAEIRFPPGSRHRGIVKCWLMFGMFVQVAPNIEGLIPQTELEQFVGREQLPLFSPTEEGVEVEVVVSSIDRQGMMLDLSLAPGATIPPALLTPPAPG
ncbi:MAG: hypothetical protein K2W96_26895 [Gemmataceae bacterium]|nr:hypothetical protein [Gemmataceae bacterium]